MGTRNILTVYSHRNKVVKKTTSAYAFNAVPNCVRRMQNNQYGADVAEVYDHEDGVLHAVVRRSVDGSIRIVFKREVKEGE